LVLCAVMHAQGRALIAASAAIGKTEFATSRGLKRDPSLRFVARDADPGRIGDLAARPFVGSLSFN
jgi:hypothetical protein